MARKKKKVRSDLLTIIGIGISILVIIFFYAKKRNSKLVPEVSAQAGISSSEIAEDYVKILDVGQGDSAMLVSGKQCAFIDAGEADVSTEVINAVRNANLKKIDFLYLSHNHTDHFGGALALAEQYSVLNIIIPDLGKSLEKTNKITAIRNEVLASDGESFTATTGLHKKMGNIDFYVIGYYPDASDENNRSVITSVVMNGYKFLFTGDAEKESENKLIDDGIDLKSDVLKVGHHGSRYASTTAFLKAVDPTYATISCKENNQYNHPHKEALKRLQKEGITILRTDVSGEITFFAEDNKLKAVTER